MEDEFYHLTVKGNDLNTYVRRFHELATLCPNMVPNIKKLMEVFIEGLPISIEGNVTASKPQTLEEAINISQRLMDQLLKHNPTKETNYHKQKFDDRRSTTNNNNNYPNDRNNKNHYHNHNNNNYQNNYDNNSNNRNNDHHQQQNRRQEAIKANDIYAAGSESRPPMLNKENYVPWSSRLLRYAKSRPNGMLIHNSILNGPYVRRMIPEPGDTEQLKQIEADDQAIQTILLSLPEDIYAATKDLHTTDYTQLYDFLKYNQKEIDELKAERLAKIQDPLALMKEVDELKAERLVKIQDPLALMANSNNPYASPTPHQDLSLFNQNYMQQPMPNPEDITDPTSVMNMALSLMAKAFKLNYSTPTNNNQRISSNPRNRQIAQPGMNMGQDRQMQMVGGNGGNQFRQYAGQNAGNLNGYNAVQNVRNQVAQNPRIQNDGNQNRIGNGNLVAVRAEGNATGHNGNQLRCYNCRGVGHFARDCTVRPRRRDAAYLQTQLLIAQKEEAEIQLQAKEYDLMAAAADLDEIEEVNANCILMANLQQA
nr:reverse transcriptase domain-containing protein [Tanacetum cinerariifolium]